MAVAATRDASWYSHPEVTYTKAVHVSTEDSMAVCDSGVFLSDSPRWKNASEVPVDLRCKRRACARAYDRESIL